MCSGSPQADTDQTLSCSQRFFPLGAKLTVGLEAVEVGPAQRHVEHGVAVSARGSCLVHRRLHVCSPQSITSVPTRRLYMTWEGWRFLINLLQMVATESELRRGTGCD